MNGQTAGRIIDASQGQALLFDANVSILFGDRATPERAALARSAGFDAIEMWWPFDRSVPGDAEVDRLVASVADEGLGLVLLNLDDGHGDAQEHGLLGVPGQTQRFRDNVDVAVGIAGRLGGRAFNALYGNVDPDVSTALQRDTAVENLVYATHEAATVGAQIVLEPLNPVDFPRYGLRRIEDAIELADRARSEANVNVGVLFDVYNVQRTQGDLLRRIEAYAARFGHVQIADVPQRLHPGTGEIAFGPVFEGLIRAGYQGFVGLEYRPSPNPDETFAWLPRKWRGSSRGEAK